jgi:hypothetical protein
VNLTFRTIIEWIILTVELVYETLFTFYFFLFTWLWAFL